MWLSRLYISYFLWNMTLKNYFSNILQRSPAHLNSGNVVLNTNALDNWAMMTSNLIKKIQQFYKVFKSPHCDVGSLKKYDPQSDEPA